MLPTPEIDTDIVQPALELETPVAVSEVVAPLGPFARASLLAELATREREDSFSGEVAAVAAGVKLPATLKETLAMLREVQASRPKDKFEAKVRAIKLEKLAAHHLLLCQGPSSPPIDHAAFFKRQPSALALEHIASLYPKAKTRKV
jgi:hypothetical protein